MDLESPPPPPGFMFDDNGNIIKIGDSTSLHQFENNQASSDLIIDENSETSADLTKDDSSTGKVFLIAGVSIFIILIITLIAINSSNSAPTPPYVPLPTYTNRPISKIVTLTKPKPIIKPTQTEDGLECTSWNSVSINQVGQTICVYGYVVKSYAGDKQRFFIRFSDNSDDFRMIVLGGFYFGEIVGKCVYSTGEIKAYGKMPYMEVGEKFSLCK